MRHNLPLLFDQILAALHIANAASLAPGPIFSREQKQVPATTSASSRFWTDTRTGTPTLTLFSILLVAVLTPLQAADVPIPQSQRPLEPKRPFPYEEVAVKFENTRANVKLAGTLTRPQGAGPFAAALLVAGSGKQTRDEFVAGHRIFLVLSDYLTRRGLAVLRYDKRGVGQSTGGFDQATTLDFAEDAAAGMEFLKGRKDIDPKCIGAIGHSEGGLIMPTLAVNWPDAAFVVMLAGVATSGQELLQRQDYLVGKAQGLTDEELAKHAEMFTRWFELLNQGKDGVEIERQLRPLVELTCKGDKKEIDQQVADFYSPWWRCFLTHSVTPALEKVRCPLMALNGSKDIQVPPTENLRAIARAMTVSGNTDFVIREMPGLNHGFQHCQTGSPKEYSKIEETMSLEVLQMVGDWILQHVTPIR